MATDINTILSWFKTGLKPTQTQFWASWQSFWHKDEQIPQSSIENLSIALNAKVEKSQFDGHITDPNAHAESIGGKLDKAGYDGDAKKLSDRIAAIENPDRVLKFGTIKLTGLDLNISANDFAWVLNNESFLSPNAYSHTLIAATTGMYRNDIVVGNTFGDYEIVKGNEAVIGTAASEPAVPINTIKLGFISLFGATVIGSGSEPSQIKSTIVDTDRVNIDDSEDRFSNKLVQFSNFKKKMFTGDINLPNYPNTRNDGQIPMNKVLSTDANGNLKMYTIPIVQAPFLKELIPDSYLPNTRGNILIRGEFFIPQMCDRINNPNGIIIGGVATIHYANFVNSQEILVNVTTGSLEGSFPCTLNNGLITTKQEALLIVLGTMHKLNASDFTTISPFLKIDNGTVSFNTFGDGFSYKSFSGFLIPENKDFRLCFQFIQSKLGYNLWDRGMNLGFSKSSDNSRIWQIKFHYGNYTSLLKQDVAVGFGQYETLNSKMTLPDLSKISPNGLIYMERIAGVMKWVAPNGEVSATSTFVYNGELKLSADLINAELIDLKYIELAT